jgi:proteasome lid subunit RPN8/RPN11
MNQFPRPTTPALRFSPTAWAKLLYLRDLGPTEIGAFGIADKDDLLYVADLALVEQTTSAVTVSFADDAVADFFDSQVDLGRRPDQFARIWLHTHPGDSARPSRTDEATFARVFGRAEWAVMFILACGGQFSCRLQFHVGPGSRLQLPVELDLQKPFAGSDLGRWQLEYAAAVRPEEDLIPARSPSKLFPAERLDDEFNRF